MNLIKKITILCLILLASIQADAQIENEIRSYVDSTEIIVNNGKRLLLDEIRLFNYGKVAEIYSLLNKKTEPNKCTAFTYNEHLFIALFTSDWNTFLNKAEGIKTDRNFLCYQNSQSIQRELYEEFMKYNDVLLRKMQTADLNQEDADLFDLYFETMTNGRENKSIYEAKLKSFKKKYPTSRYDDFLKIYLPSPELHISMAFSFGVATAFPQGNLKENFSLGAVGPSMDMTFDREKWYFGLSVYSSYMKSQSDFSATSDKNELYEFHQGDKFDFTQVGFRGGYYLLKTKHFGLAPYLELGNASLRSDIYTDAQDNNKEMNMFSSFYLGPGFHSELKLFSFKGSNPNNWNANPPSYLSLRLDAGYSIITNQKHDILKGNVFYTTLKLAWAIGDF